MVRKKPGEKYQQGSKAQGRWDPEGKCYLAQKQSCAYKEESKNKENNQNRLSRNLPRKKGNTEATA